MPTLAIVSDDLTGACDSAIQLRVAGFRASVFIGHSFLPSSSLCDVIAVSTESRELDSAQAVTLVKEAVQMLKPLNCSFHYKKVDSLMRGNVFEEISVCMEALEYDYCLLAPAYPDNNRRLVNGAVHLSGANDVIRTVDVKLSSVNNDVPIRQIHLTDVMRGAQHLAELIKTFIRNGPCILLTDAATNNDLQIISDAVHLVPARCLPAGSAGLIRHMLSNWPRPDIAQISDDIHAVGKTSERVLIVAGSLSPVTRSQIDYVRDLPEYTVYSLDTAGFQSGNTIARQRAVVHAIKQNPGNVPSRVVITGGPANSQDSLSDPAPSRTVAEALAGITRQVVEFLNPGAIILTGGETASVVLTSLGIHSIDLYDEPIKGVSAGFSNSTLIITKSGGFGDRDALSALARYAIDTLRMRAEVISPPCPGTSTQAEEKREDMKGKRWKR